MKDQRKLLDALLAGIAIKSEASASVYRGRTGRTLDYHQPHEIQADILAGEWMALNSPDQMMSHAARKRFESEIRNVPIVSGDQSMLRGRDFDPHDTDRNLPTSYGPPPPERCKLGRYNAIGEPVLYLSSSETGVRSEVQAPLDRVLMCQAFVIPSGIRIADLARSDIDPFLANAFDRAEHADISDYFKSNVLAKLVSQDFQGMLVPGVRGTRDNWYSNLIMFEPEGNWSGWLESSSFPKELKEPI